MADNFNATAGDGSVIGAADDIGGVKFPRVKMIIGADGTNDGDVSSANPLPVTVSGTVTVGSHAVTNAGTFAVQATVAAGATTIAKVEDAASANADVGVPAMAIQLATPTDLAGTDADYAMLQMSAGRLWTSAKIDTALPAGSNVIGGITIAAGATNIAKAEDAASANADVGVPAMAIQKASPADTAGTDGDYAMLQMSAGRLWASATIDAALPAGTNVIGHVIVDSGAVVVTNAGTFAVQATVAAAATNIAKAEDVASADADVGVPAMAVRKATPANTSGTDGDYEMLQMSAGKLWTRAQTEGGTAADAALANAPVTIGGRATNTNLAEMSTDGDVVDAQFTMQGALVTAHGPRELLAIQQTQLSNTTSETTIITAGASGIFNDLYGLILANTGASATKVTIKDATSGTTRAIIYVPVGETRGFMLPAASAIPQASAANNWTATCGTATTAMEITAMYIKRK